MNNIVIPDGNQEIEVLGEQYRVEILQKIFKSTNGSKILFSLTPQSEYQKKEQWPRMPFVNVNLYGSKETFKDNWLGYIPGRFTDIDLPKLFKSYKSVSVHGYVKKSGKDYDLVMTVNESYIYLH